MKTDEQVGHGVTHLCAEHERAFQKTESMVNDGASGIVLDMHKHFRGLIRRWFSLGYQSGKIAGRQEAIDEMAGVEGNLRSINSSVTAINEKQAGRIKQLEDESHNALKCVTEQATRIKALEDELLHMWKNRVSGNMEENFPEEFKFICALYPLAAKLDEISKQEKL